MLPREPASHFQAGFAHIPDSLFSLFIFFLVCILDNTWGAFLVYSHTWYIIFVLSKTSSFLHLLLDPSFGIHLLSSYYVLSTVLDNWGIKICKDGASISLEHAKSRGWSRIKMLRKAATSSSVARAH